LIPLLPDDFAARPHMDIPGWPIGPSVLVPHIPEIESIFGLDGGSYEEEFVREIGAAADIPAGDSDFMARFAKWPLFRLRNVATLLKHRIDSDPDFAIWINATATRFGFEPGQNILCTVTASHENGTTLTVRAAHVAVCAGAIESTRLLLLLNA